MAKTLKINLMLNTGHHYFFFPLTEFSQQGTAIGDSCDNNEHKWCVVENWCRYCYGTKNDKNSTKGVYICIDTNRGTKQRGTLASSKPTEIDKETWQKENEGTPSPYIVSNAQQKATENIKILGTDIKLEWKKNTEGCRPVDLIVDFGNSRTVILALENGGAGKKLSDFCYPIVFLKRREELENLDDENRGDDLSRIVVDSWFVLKQHEFGDLEKNNHFSYVFKDEKGTKPKKILGIPFGEEAYEVRHYLKETRFPQQFVEVSPSIMGKEAAEFLANASSKCEGFSMSSPKRYIWDDEKIPTSKLPWQMLPNTEESAQNTTPLGGQICRYIFENGNDWALNKPPFLCEKAYGTTMNPDEPRFPRRETMVWSALSIIEMAYREINSTAWREGNNSQIRRRLNSVALTYPSGWIREEKKAFKEAWDRAANIFAHAHYEDPEKERPEIILEIDEAVASQMPYVFRSIYHARNDEKLNKVDVWIDEDGKNHNGASEPSVRLMTIDIGGGTLDASIVEYTSAAPGDKSSPGGEVNHKLLFRDSNNHAGDDAIKNIIERVLMPLIFDKMNFEYSSTKEREKCQEQFRNYFYRGGREEEKAVRSRITKILLLPIAQHWLSLLGKEEEDNPKTSIADIVGAKAGKIITVFNKEMRKEFGKKEGWNSLLPPSQVHLPFKKEEIEKCIVDALTPGIKVLESVVRENDVDKIVLSGKITEIPIVKEICSTELGIPMHRIQRMKNFVAGEWYPRLSGKNGKICDAKTVTAVGAALHRAFSLGLINHWIFDKKKANAKDNFWGVIDEALSNGGFVNPWLKPGEKRKSIRAVIGSRIGRMSIASPICRPQQEYILMWEDGVPPPGDPKKWRKINLEIVRDYDEKTGDEFLKIEPNSWTTIDDNKPLPKAVKLKHNTLGDDDAFWADVGRFNIKFKPISKSEE